MKQIAKLKDEARKYEQREEWDRAIQAYGEVLRLGEAGDGAELDLPLYNRVGDLYVRLGRAAEAVKYYEQAADKYAEAGLYNNAIALCNKALRYDAGRVELLKKLGQFSASQGFFTDARRWYLEYCERMSKRGAIDEAFQALSELADVHDDPEIRELLARQLKDHNHTERAIDEYRRAYALRTARGETGAADAIRAEIHALDPDASLEVTPREGGGGYHTATHEELPGFLDEPRAPPTEVAFDGPVQTSTLDTDIIELETETVAGSLDAQSAGNDFETIDLEQPLTAGPDALDDLIPFDLGIEPSLEFKPPVEEPVDSSEGDAFDEAALMDTDSDEFLTLPEFDVGDTTAEAEADTFSDFDLALPSFEEEETVEEEAAEEEEAAPLPGWDELGEEAGVGESDSLPLMETDFAAEAESEREEWPRFQLEESTDSVSEPLLSDEDLSVSDQEFRPFTPPPIFEIEPVEPLAESAPVFEPEPGLEPEPEPESELEPELEPEVAPEAEPEHVFEAPAESLPIAEPEVPAEPEYAPEPEPVRAPPPSKPAPRPSAPAPDYVDLGAFLLDDPEPEDTTRFVVAEKAPSGDEERDFAEMLQQFKAKVAETIPKEDAGSHYDLGLAFKEMGLVDEAIAEFQTALRGGEEKLKVYEELGNCFVQKRQYSVAITILTRATQMPYSDEAELLGVYYNLGRAHEELGQHSEARSAYERIISVDIGFQDTSERLAKL
jgi:tetratricopeptide (TPR) repeat protein